jgi:hypothetical protein
MAIEEERKVNWLYLASILWFAIGAVCICPAGTVIVFFDSPSPNWNANYFFIFSVIFFPIVCIGSSFGIRFLKNKHKKLAFYVSLFPVLPIILIFVANTWMSLASCGKFDCRIPTMQEQSSSTPIAKCALPILDGGDGLETTGCGLLEFGINVAGITNSTSEAQNWQFSVQNTNQITITIENDGKSCPTISILDSSDSIIEGFEDNISLCPSGMTTTSFFYFDPPTKGTYIIRLITPATPGTYWLKIE